MKTKNNFLLSFIALSGLLFMTSCDFGGGGGIDKTEANRKVLDAVNKMATSHIHSFELDLGVDVSYDGVLSSLDDEEELVTETISIDADVDLGIKASKLFGDEAEASIILDASLDADLALEALEEPLDLELEAKVGAYLKEGWAYADLTEGMDVLALIFGLMMPAEPSEPEEPDALRLMDGEPADEMPTKLKYEIGNLSELFNLEDDFSLVPEPIDFDSILPHINGLHNVSAKVVKGEINVVYTITMDDLVDIVSSAFLGVEDDTLPVDEGETSIDPKDIVRAMLEEMIEIREAKLTIGIGSDGYLSKVYVDVDVEVDIEDEEYQETQSHKLDASVHLDIANINKSVSVSFPDDLDSYYELTDEDFEELE